MRVATAIAAVALFASVAAAQRSTSHSPALVADPGGVIDLPAGFTVTIVSRKGDEMDDGLLVPGLCDGMAAFPGPDGTVIVVRNHEATFGRDGPFGEKYERLARIPAAKLYDLGLGLTPCPGGTTTFVWDPKSRKLVRQFLSLAGTMVNCSGGATPWGTWLTCEETMFRAGTHQDGSVHLQKDHGYVFEVPAEADPGLADPVPLRALGRFYHEGALVDPRTSIVYLTEDLDDGLLYRFVPGVKGDLKVGRLQALALADGRRDARNWGKGDAAVRVGERLAVRWIDMDDVEAPRNDLRTRGHDLGACVFACGEGLTLLNGAIYFTCTNGGGPRLGQVYRYTPGANEGTARESKSPGTLELFVESSDAQMLANPDNLTTTTAGELLICEDTAHHAPRLVVVARDGRCRTFAQVRSKSEFAGVTFSPDGSTLFVNVQKEGLTLAIQGPWSRI